MATNSADLSIVVISYNTKSTTVDCLNSIISSLHDSPITYEIIIVDNASTDGSQEQILQLKSKHPHTRIKSVFNTENTGFARANNLAMKSAGT